MRSIPKTLKEKANGVNKKQIALKCAPYVIFGYVLNKVSWLYGQQAGDNTLQNVLDTINGIGGAFHNPLPSFLPRDLLVGVGCGIGFRMVVYYKAKNAKKFRQGVEYGSARWGTAKDIEPYVDPVFENNVLLTATERLMMSGRPKQPKYARNKNILVIGGSGSGKTRFFVKPNLMQMVPMWSLIRKALCWSNAAGCCLRMITGLRCLIPLTLQNLCITTLSLTSGAKRTF